MKTSILLLAGIASLWAVPAVAETNSVSVNFAGLDLTSVEGKTILGRRIKGAVRVICGAPEYRDLAATLRTKRCITEAMARTQPRVDLAIAAASRSDVRIAAAR
jgi:UrcA family protein